jgi:hypothetical protein
MARSSRNPRSIFSSCSRHLAASFGRDRESCVDQPDMRERKVAEPTGSLRAGTSAPLLLSCSALPGVATTEVANRIDPKLATKYVNGLSCAPRRVSGFQSNSQSHSSLRPPAASVSKNSNAPGTLATHFARAQHWRAGSTPMLKPSTTVGIALLQLREGQCRWPVDDKQPPRRFCAAPTVGTRSWCEVHAQRAFGTLREARWARRTG